MKKWTFGLFALFFSLQLSYSQDCLGIDNIKNETAFESLLEGALDVWCEEHFKDCFNWTFVDIQSISDFRFASNGDMVVEGTNRNKGYFGKTYERKFKATLRCLNDDLLEVEFKKQQIIGGEESWLHCKKTIRL